MHASSPYADVSKRNPRDELRYPPPQRRFVCYDGDDHRWVDAAEPNDEAVAAMGGFPSGGKNPLHFSRNSRLMNTVLDEGGVIPNYRDEL